MLAKDIAGDPTSFKIIIKINVEVITKNKFNIVESFNYNNIKNKFDLEQYEREIISNLAETATEKLIYKLSNI